MRITQLLVVVVCAGCAAAKVEEKMSAEDAFSAAPTPVAPAAASKQQLGSPKEWAAAQRRDIDCAQAAKGLEQTYPHDTAWSYLKACIVKGGFTQLKMLCDDWTNDLKTRPEAGSLIAQVIAARGGNLTADLQIVQQYRIPLFELAAALKQASAFKGRYLLVVGKISETREGKGKTELVVQEQKLTSEKASVLVGTRYGSVSSSSGSGSANWKSNGIAGSGSASGSYSKSGSSESGKVETRFTDSFEDSGQEVLAKIKQPDPFIRVDKNMIFLVRFDGSVVADTENTNEGEEPKHTALVTLISYYDL